MFIRDTDHRLGALSDITQNGLLVSGDSVIELEEDLAIQINLPEEFYGSNRICLDVAATRSVKDEISGYVNTGFRIVSISEEDRILINRALLEWRI